MKRVNDLILSTVTAAFLVGCGGGGGSSSSNEPIVSNEPVSTGTDVTVERGAVYGATVTDASGQVATQKSGTNVYIFATTPVYPISANGGIIDVDNNGIDEGDIKLTTTLTSYSTVVTPITTYIGNPTTTEGEAKLAKLKEIAKVTNDDDLLKVVPSSLGTDVLVLTNALFDIMNDGDSSNDDFVSDYDNSAFKTKIADYTKEADKYTDKIEKSKALEEKVIATRGFTKINLDEANNALNGTDKASLLKVADLSRFVSYDGDEDYGYNGNPYWYEDNTISNNIIKSIDYILSLNSVTNKDEWSLYTEDTMGLSDNMVITTDATNPYKLSYVNSKTKEKGEITMLSTKKVNEYSNLYLTKDKRVVTEMATELEWYRSGTPNRTYVDSSNYIKYVLDIDSLYDYLSKNHSSNVIVTKESDRVVLTSKDRKEHSYFKIVIENYNYYIEQADLNDVGYTEEDNIYTGTSLDEFIANIKTPAPQFTSQMEFWVNENQTNAFTAVATPGRDSLTIKYSISGGADADKFNIDSTTGVVTFKTAPDYEYEIKQIYYVDITATDSLNKSSTQYQVNVFIKDVAEPFQSGEKYKGLVYNIVTSPITGKQWLDRNLGATQTCTSSTDSACYGDYYQWGRLADGHEKATSGLTATQATSITNAGDKFVSGSMDWTTVDSDGALRTAQWNKTDGTGICPVGFRVPTLAELKTETLDNGVTNSATAFSNFLKLPEAGRRVNYGGGYNSVGSAGYIRTSDYSSGMGGLNVLNFTNSTSGTVGYYPAMALSVRCIKEN